MLNISTENFTHNRILRADNTFLTSKDYEFVNFFFASNPINKCEAKFANREHAQHSNLKNFYFDDVTKNYDFWVI